MPLHPVGFSPAAISARVNVTVVSYHAEEAAFLWTQRDRATGEPHFLLKDLCTLDERVEAQLHGLRVAGDAGWHHSKALLETPGAGEVFAASVLAFGAGDRERMREALFAGCTSALSRRGLVSALGWLEYPAVAPWIDALLAARTPEHRFVGIATCAAHRHDPGAPLAAALGDADPSLRSRAARAIGEIKRRDLLNQVRAHLHEDDGSCRFWASWALLLNGERAALPMIIEWIERRDNFSRTALDVGLRAMRVEESRKWISARAQSAEWARETVMATGIVGDPASVAWLIRRMAIPDLKRLAGESFQMITGVDLAFHDLVEDAPEPADTEAAAESDLVLDYESNLPWPSPELVARWWERNHQRFTPGARYLAGVQIDGRAMTQVLRDGTQRQRAAAALELALGEPERPLFEVRARGNAQLGRLATWSS